jgi:ABC-type Fe3+-hydroxamate transport system substrate-binding protein
MSDRLFFMQNQNIRTVITAVLLTALVFSVSGCRKSPVIEEIIYDQNASQVDWNSKVALTKENPDAPTIDPTLPVVRPPEKVEQKQEPLKEPAGQGEEKATGSTPRLESDPNANEGTAPAKTPDADANRNPDTPGNEPAGQDDEDKGLSDDPNSRQITDASGKAVDLPEKVNKVVATAGAAPMVQMLGGQDILAGTASDFKNNSLAMKVFGAEGVSAAETLWSGSGSSAMSAANFKRLLEMKPDVCIAMSGENSFTSAQKKELKKNKIAYVTLPAMNTHTNIKKAAEVAGKMIGDRSGEPGGVDAAKLASAYASYTDGLISKVSAKVGGRFAADKVDYNNDAGVNGKKTFSGANNSKGKYTLYISEWESSAKYKMLMGGTTLFTESGLAVAPQGYSKSPLSYYMSVAGTCNNGAALVNTEESRWPAIPLNVNTVDNDIEGSSLKVYTVKGVRNISLTRIDGDGSCLGDENFPAVVVASKSVKNKLEASDYLWKNYEPRDVDGDKLYGFFGSDNSTWIASYIRGDYEIHVNPAGVYPWTEGSPESFLETIWTAAKFFGKYSDEDVANQIKDFYKKFYRYDLAGSEIDGILAGN